MILTKRVSGPSYSTDAIAAGVSGFLKSQTFAASDRGATEMPGGVRRAPLDLEALYPSLFNEESTTPRHLIAIVRAAVASFAGRRARLASTPR